NIFFQRDNSKFRRLVWWTPPPKGCVKINCDGAYTRNGKKAAAGGVLRDSDGEFLFAFSSVLRVSSSAEAELFVIKLGMEIGISMGYSNLIVESDSLSAIQLINWRVIQQTHQFYALVSSIIHMAANVHHITSNHAYRETNSAADVLAKYGLSLSSNSPVILFKFPPNFLLLPLCADKIGTMYYR
ncbi:hypothetical protein V8G54_010683, partial [Vigna mungo]